MTTPLGVFNHLGHVVSAVTKAPTCGSPGARDPCGWSALPHARALRLERCGGKMDMTAGLGAQGWTPSMPPRKNQAEGDQSQGQHTMREQGRSWQHHRHGADSQEPNRREISTANLSKLSTPESGPWWGRRRTLKLGLGSSEYMQQKTLKPLSLQKWPTPWIAVRRLWEKPLLNGAYKRVLLPPPSLTTRRLLGSVLSLSQLHQACKGTSGLKNQRSCRSPWTGPSRTGRVCPGMGPGDAGHNAGRNTQNIKLGIKGMFVHKWSRSFETRNATFH